MKSSAALVALTALICSGARALAVPAALTEDLQTLRSADLPGKPVDAPARGQENNEASNGTSSPTAAMNPIPPLAPPAVSDSNSTNVSATESGQQTTGSDVAAVLPAGQTLSTLSLNAAQSPDKPHTVPFPQGPDPLNPWQSATLLTLALAGLGLFGWSLVRFRKRATHHTQRTEKPLQVVSSLPLSPKRQLMLIRVRDQEILVSSTEQGIALLTELTEKPTRTQLPEARSHVMETRSIPALPRPSEIAQETRATLTRAAQGEAPTEAQEERKPVAKKSDFLSKALNNIKEKKQTEASQPPPTPTLPQTRANFGKLVANAFEQEAKRPLPGKSDDNADDTVESVTRMIRERLKSIQPTEGSA